MNVNWLLSRMRVMPRVVANRHLAHREVAGDLIRVKILSLTAGRYFHIVEEW